MHSKYEGEKWYTVSHLRSIFKVQRDRKARYTEDALGMTMHHTTFELLWYWNDNILGTLNE